MNITRNLSKSLDKRTEAEIQFELAYKLKKMGFDIRLERTIVLEETFRIKKRTSRNCSIRVDILILRKDKIICVIEVKNFVNDSKINTENRQFKKYLSLGIPFVFCLSENKINSTAKAVLKIYIKSKNGNNNKS